MTMSDMHSYDQTGRTNHSGTPKTAAKQPRTTQRAKAIATGKGRKTEQTRGRGHSPGGSSGGDRALASAPAQPLRTVFASPLRSPAFAVETRNRRGERARPTKHSATSANVGTKEPSHRQKRGIRTRNKHV